MNEIEKVYKNSYRFSNFVNDLSQQGLSKEEKIIILNKVRTSFRIFFQAKTPLDKKTTKETILRDKILKDRDEETLKFRDYYQSSYNKVPAIKCNSPRGFNDQLEKADDKKNIPEENSIGSQDSIQEEINDDLNVTQYDYDYHQDDSMDSRYPNIEDIDKEIS